MKLRSYERLIVWQEAHRLCKQTYSLTKAFPTDERFGLVSQMRRSSYGIPMNIVEGNVRRSRKEKAHFMSIALGSLEELHYQTRLANELGYIDQNEAQAMDSEIQKVGFLLTRLRTALL